MLTNWDSVLGYSGARDDEFGCGKLSAEVFRTQATPGTVGLRSAGFRTVGDALRTDSV